MKNLPMTRRVLNLLLAVLLLLLPCLAFAEEPKQMAVTIVVEPHYSLRALDVILNDPYYPSQWNLHKIGAPAAWQITTGSDSVIIAFVDSGVDLDHPELKDKIVDGWDFVNWDNEPQDDYGHGTFVASIAAAETNNGLGMAGVSWGAKIMPIKVFDEEGVSYHWHTAGGITYAADNGAKIINLSFSGTDSQPLQDAVNYAHSKGALVVAAAGDSHDDSYQYPAALDNVVSVAATTPDDEHPDFSTCNDKVDVAAPGVDILGIYSGGYGRLSGTDAAVPHVSGLAALVWSVNPTLTPDEVESIIESTAVDLGEPGRDECFGHGRIDAAAAVMATPCYLQVEPDSLHFLVCDDSNSLPLTITSTSPCTWNTMAPWFSISPPGGYTTSTITVTIDIGALPDYGVYTATITATSTLTSCVNSPLTITITVNYAPQCWRSYLPLLFKNHGPY